MALAVKSGFSGLHCRRQQLTTRPVLPACANLCKPRLQVLTHAADPQYPAIPSATEDFSPPPGAVSPVNVEQEQLRQSAGTIRNLSFVAFWLQFALSIVSAGILLFSVAFVPKNTGMASSVEVSKYLTMVGVAAAFISSMLAHGFLQLGRKLGTGAEVAKSWLVGSLLTNNTICLAGIGITVIGMQASVGTLVAKTLVTAVSGPLTVASAAGGLVSLDVFSLQASTNTLLCHVIGLLFTNLLLRVVNKQPRTA